MKATTGIRGLKQQMFTKFEEMQEYCGATQEQEDGIMWHYDADQNVINWIHPQQTAEGDFLITQYDQAATYMGGTSFTSIEGVNKGNTLWSIEGTLGQGEHREVSWVGQHPTTEPSNFVCGFNRAKNVLDMTKRIRGIRNTLQKISDASFDKS